MASSHWASLLIGRAQFDCLDAWDIQTQQLDRRVNGKLGSIAYAPVFWTNKGTRILAAFNLDGSHAKTFYEFDASTLEIVGAPFKGHIQVIRGLALSSDGALVATALEDSTIKLWALESRQLLTSTHVINPKIVVF
ncbi:hypothetical protein K503DRAFT_806858 [Rhizopogon vinicolor AM-OR11-026]|uniref:Uncharacterized protein n=1 Tax=Rhizopogon vinicolor AM-OR11-026 TaxID=1314800 RepID=A0A1B7MDM8_9AGAM|nr:hypothetical protein K503DRAFT_806858 [Rhizopogon vinicolor AM-OR11-026]